MLTDAAGIEAPSLLPPGFHFSQSSLQDYLDCRRRFQLRFIANLGWPAAESEPALAHERYIQQGVDLHHLIHQYLLGIPRDILEAGRMDPVLRLWWQDFLAFASVQQIPGSGQVWAERSLSCSYQSFRIVAKFDLVQHKSDGSLVIYDWKTSQRLPNPRSIARRVQKRLYPYMLVKAGFEMNGGVQVEPEKIVTAFWYTSQPGQPLVFPYNREEFQNDRNFIEGLIEEIAHLPADQFHQTRDLKRCGFCTYRSLCSRGEKADTLQNWLDQAEDVDLSELQIDFDSIPELDL